LKTNLTITLDAKVLEKFNQVKGDQLISHLVQYWITQFLEKKTEFGPIPKTKPDEFRQNPTPKKEGGKT